MNNFLCPYWKSKVGDMGSCLVSLIPGWICEEITAKDYEGCPYYNLAQSKKEKP